MSCSLMRPLGFLTIETLRKTMLLIMLLGQHRGKHLLSKCGKTGALLGLRDDSFEPLVLFF